MWRPRTTVNYSLTRVATPPREFRRPQSIGRLEAQQHLRRGGSDQDDAPDRSRLTISRALAKGVRPVGLRLAHGPAVQNR